MSIVDLIKSFSIHLSPTMNKTTGDNSSESKLKVKNVQGDVAGRDIHKTYVSTVTKEKEMPYVSLIGGAIGGNGHQLRIMTCQIHNLSDQHVFIEQIEALGRAINFSDALIKPGDNLRFGDIDGLSCPTTDTPQYVEILFHNKENEHFKAKQMLKLKSRADGKFDIAGFASPVVEAASATS